MVTGAARNSKIVVKLFSNQTMMSYIRKGHIRCAMIINGILLIVDLLNQDCSEIK